MIEKSENWKINSYKPIDFDLNLLWCVRALCSQFHWYSANSKQNLSQGTFQGEQVYYGFLQNPNNQPRVTLGDRLGETAETYG